MGLERSIRSRIKTAERLLIPRGWKPADRDGPKDELDRYIEGQLGNPGGEHGATLAHYWLVVAELFGNTTGELTRHRGHPEKWTYATPASALAMRNFARDLRAGIERDPETEPDAEMVARLLKTVGFKPDRR